MGEQSKLIRAGRSPETEAKENGMEEQDTKTRRPSLKKKRLFSTCEENPRRGGSRGHASHEIVMANPGITYEEFREKGGRSNDAHWDIDRGWMRAE